MHGALNMQPNRCIHPHASAFAIVRVTLSASDFVWDSLRPPGDQKSDVMGAESAVVIITAYLLPSSHAFLPPCCLSACSWLVLSLIFFVFWLVSSLTAGTDQMRVANIQLLPSWKTLTSLSPTALYCSSCQSDETLCELSSSWIWREGSSRRGICATVNSL